MFSMQKCVFVEARSIGRRNNSFLKLNAVPHHRFYYSDYSHPQNLPSQVPFYDAKFRNVIKGMRFTNLFFNVPSGERLKSPQVKN